MPNAAALVDANPNGFTTGACAVMRIVAGHNYL